MSALRACPPPPSGNHRGWQLVQRRQARRRGRQLCGCASSANPTRPQTEAKPQVDVTASRQTTISQRLSNRPPLAQSGQESRRGETHAASGDRPGELIKEAHGSPPSAPFSTSKGPALNIQAIELRRIRLPLVSAFRTTLGTEDVREALIVRIESDKGQGWGECVAGADPLYSPEYVDSAWLTISRYLGPSLLRAREVKPDDVRQVLGRVKGHRMAKAALEMAVLDAELRLAGISLSKFLGGVRDTVTPGVAVGIMSSVAELLDSVSEYCEAGYRRVKLKIEPGWDLEPVAAVRDALRARADVAGGRQRLLPTVRHRSSCLARPVLPAPHRAAPSRRGPDRSRAAGGTTHDACVPRRVDRLGRQRGHRYRARRLLGRQHQGRTRRRLLRGACRPRRLRLRRRPRLVRGHAGDRARRAANLALASLPGFSLPGDISASDRYFREDITAPFVLRNGEIAVPNRPGSRRRGPASRCSMS